jgi:hypothetical protein
MTDWNFTTKTGATWLAGQEDITAGQEEYDNKVVCMGNIGTQTTYDYQLRD